MATSGTSSSSTGGGCSPGLTECDGECVDTNADPSNCGHCGGACAGGETCVNATCAIQCDGTQDCGQCLDCAGSAGVCQVEVKKCLVDADCKAIVSCMGTCTDQACSSECLAQHPVGAPIWTAAFQCAHCNACPGDCQLTSCP